MAEILKFVGPAASFDSDMTAVLGSVFDETISRLNGQEAEIVREVVASRIIMLASKGERDPDRLRKAALAALDLTCSTDGAGPSEDARP